MRFIDLVVLLDVVQRSQFAHPDSVLLRQKRSEQVRLASLHIDRTEEIRLSHAERPVEVGFLTEDRLVIRW